MEEAAWLALNGVDINLKAMPFQRVRRDSNSRPLRAYSPVAQHLILSDRRTGLDFVRGQSAVQPRARHERSCPDGPGPLRGRAGDG
jgi:hypothetical protein